jgi:DNA topoisomerase-2
MPPKSKTIEEIYQKLTPIEHILKRPDSYIGSLSLQKDKQYVYENEKIIKKEITYPPGLMKIFDEILVNARDHYVNDPSCDCIKVTIDISQNEISVMNNGKGIDIEIHKEHNVYVPELIFGHLLTSTNYDDTEKRTTGGRNGYGAKLTNIFSNFFSIETVDGKTKKKYYQEFKNNMGEKSVPIITDLKARSETLTKIVFRPDLEKFGLENLTPDIISLLTRRVYDIAGMHPKIKVYFNDKKIESNTFKKYISLYDFGEIKIERLDVDNDVSTVKEDDDNISISSKSSNKEKEKKDDFIYELENERWKIAVMYHPTYNHEAISFVNGICTYNGGNHVDYIVNNIIERLKTIITKKHKDITFKPQMVKDNLIIFIDSVIENPSFTSQTKETLKTKASDFGSKCEISDKFIKKLSVTGIFDQVLMMAKIKDQAILKKTDGKKTTKLLGYPQLEDCSLAGTKRSSECLLFLTEGLSAMTLAVAGRVVIGSEKYGIFPLRGKLLNVREANSKQLLENEEITAIKKILGLQHGKEYKDTSDLRYGGIVLLTDQDTDAFHIRALILNALHFMCPSLINLNTFVTCLNTPIVKATNSKTKNIISFYNLIEYEEWKKTNNTKDYNIKYYKGLGSSTKSEACEYFENIEDKLVYYTTTDEDYPSVVKKIYNDPVLEAITLAFQKNRADCRKEWLLNYNPNNILINKDNKVSIPHFIHNELIQFSNYDNIRSIPNICDGFKPVQRKILYGCIKKKLFNPKDELKVSQLSGFISSLTSYHHGETSMMMSIINMAQNFIGSNNINLLYPSGQFGSRIMLGSDHASPRYIFTYLNKVTRSIFREEDDIILKYLNDDGIQIEPEHYYCIIPMVLCNGCTGIGTGFSTEIACYNPLEIVDNIKYMMEGEYEPNNPKKIKPWYNKFKGRITDNEFYGVYEVVGDNKVKVTELPVGMSTQKYKEILEKLLEKSDFVIDYFNNSSDEDIDFLITLKNSIKSEDLYKKLHLISKYSINNHHLFNNKGMIKKYTIEEIFKEFYNIRIQKYQERKDEMLRHLEHELKVLKYKVLFIQNILNNIIIIYRKRKEEIINKLIELEIPELSGDVDGTPSYDYLTNMSLFSLTQEKIEEFDNKYKNKENEIENIKNTTVFQLWTKELDEFLVEYNKMLKVLEEEKQANNKIIKAGTNKPVTKAKKTAVKK